MAPGGEGDQGNAVAASPDKSSCSEAKPALTESPEFGQSVGFLLSQLGFAVSRRFHKLLEDLDIEPRDFGILRLVASVQGLSQNSVAERLQIPPSTMVAVVDNLERRGLVERRPDPHDRRAKSLYLTEGANALIGEATSVAADLEFNGVCKNLDDGERELLIDLLQKILSGFGLPPNIHPGILSEGDIKGTEN